jgi:hypothetical protein
LLWHSVVVVVAAVGGGVVCIGVVWEGKGSEDEEEEEKKEGGRRHGMGRGGWEARRRMSRCTSRRKLTVKLPNLSTPATVW